jgi:hypothetical protein
MVTVLIACRQRARSSRGSQAKEGKARPASAGEEEKEGKEMISCDVGFVGYVGGKRIIIT